MQPQPIATRTLRGTRGEVATIVLWTPNQIENGGWQCAAHITIDGIVGIYLTRGEDAFEAMMLAFEAIRIQIADMDLGLTWVGGQTGESGFRRQVPGAFGVDFTIQLERAMDEQIVEFVNATPGGVVP